MIQLMCAQAALDVATRPATRSSAAIFALLGIATIAISIYSAATCARATFVRRAAMWRVVTSVEFPTATDAKTWNSVILAEIGSVPCAELSGTAIRAKCLFVTPAVTERDCANARPGASWRSKARSGGRTAQKRS
jgi:hypothetical protein